MSGWVKKKNYKNDSDTCRFDYDLSNKCYIYSFLSGNKQWQWLLSWLCYGKKGRYWFYIYGSVWRLKINVDLSYDSLGVHIKSTNTTANFSFLNVCHENINSTCLSSELCTKNLAPQIWETINLVLVSRMISIPNQILKSIYMKYVYIYTLLQQLKNNSGVGPHQWLWKVSQTKSTGITSCLSPEIWITQ